VDCAVCQSGNQSKFTAEMMIHFNGVEGINNPGILIFPKVWICLDCGFSRFATSEIELRGLANGIASGAVIGAFSAAG
jgi:hypothetical protein